MALEGGIREKFFTILLVSEQASWAPRCEAARAITGFGEAPLQEENMWQFYSFRI